ncbi:hypothetical protein [Plantactinospora veratri]
MLRLLAGEPLPDALRRTPKAATGATATRRDSAIKPATKVERPPPISSTPSTASSRRK